MGVFLAGLFWPVIGLIVLVPAYFLHREKMAKLRIPRSEPNDAMLARIKALEKRCAQLQEQVNEAHILIHDEQRELDRKLSARLDAGGFTGTEPVASDGLKKSIGMGNRAASG